MQHHLGWKSKKEVALIKRVKLTQDFEETLGITFYKEKS